MKITPNSSQLIPLLFLGLVLGCFRGADDTRFRVSREEEATKAGPVQPVPPIASHTSAATGEVTPQIAPLPPGPPVQGAPRTISGEEPVMAPQTATSTPEPVPPGAPPTVQPPSPPRPAPVFVADLSAAVALPMTGPEGTMMGFSVDYQFRGEMPGGTCYWVIEGGPGRVYRLPVRLEPRGNLMLVVPGWRPEDGPFRCRLEDQSGRPLSAQVDMR